MPFPTSGKGIFSALKGSVDRNPVTRREVLHLLGDRDGVVGEALVVPRGERRVDRVFSAALPLLTEHGVEDAEVQRVDLVVVVADLLGEAHVLRAQQLRE